MPLITFHNVVGQGENYVFGFHMFNQLSNILMVKLVVLMTTVNLSEVCDITCTFCLHTLG